MTPPVSAPEPSTAVAPPRPSDDLQGGLLRGGVAWTLSWAVVALLVLVVAACGGALLAHVPAVRAEQEAYTAANPFRCGTSVSPPPGIRCWVGVPGRVLRTEVGHSPLGQRRDLVVVDTADGVRTIEVEGVPAFGCVQPGDEALVKLWDGATTTVFTTHGLLPTAANPGVDPDLQLEGGVALIAISVLVPSGLILAVLRRRRSGPAAAVRDTLRSPLVRIGLIAFLAGQLADVVTSAIGQERGLIEGNPVVAAFVHVAGPAGFLLFRLPAIILVLLGLTQVPRRLVAGTLLLLGGLFLAVGAHNIVLAAGPIVPSSCPIAPVP